MIDESSIEPGLESLSLYEVIDSHFSTEEFFVLDPSSGWVVVILVLVLAGFGDVEERTVFGDEGSSLDSIDGDGDLGVGVTSELDF